MELFFMILGYSVIAFIIGIGSARMEYSDAIKNNRDAVPAWKMSHNRKYNEKEIEQLEIARRKKLAFSAKTIGFVLGIIWPLTLCLGIIYIVCFGFNTVVDKIAIAPVDKPFVTQKAYDKAQVIIKEYEKQQKENFEKEIA